MVTYKPKAIFFGGISGAGKTSYVNLIKKTSKTDFLVVNSDKFAEPLLAQYNLLKMKSFDELGTNQEELNKQTKILAKAKVLVASNIETALNKRKNIILDATSRSLEEIKAKKEELENLGYETFFVLIISDLNTAIERNNMRERSLHANTIRAMYKQMDEHLKYNNFQNLFKANYALINNNTTTNIIEFERILRSNHPIKDTIDKYNKKTVTRIINWMNRIRPQNIKTVSKYLANYLLLQKQNEKFKSSINKIKDSYQFRV